MRLRCRESPERPALKPRPDGPPRAGERQGSALVRRGARDDSLGCARISASASDGRRTPPSSTGSADALLALRMAELGAV